MTARCGIEQRARVGPDGSANPAVLPGPQTVPGIRERVPSTESRRCSDLPGGPRRRTYPCAGRCSHRPGSARVASFAQIVPPSRVKLRYSCSLTVKFALIGSSVETVVISPLAGTDQIAHLHLSQPGDSVDRRGQVREAGIDLGRLDRGLSDSTAALVASICALAVSTCAFAAST